MTPDHSGNRLEVFHHTGAVQGSLDVLAGLLAANIGFRHGTDLPEPANYDILIASSPSPELLEASPRLRALIIPFAGPPERTQELLKDYPHIAVHNAPYNAVATAETALALLLASAKFLVRGDRGLRRGDWSMRYGETPQLLLQGKTALILGYGRIGRHMAPVCRALGMEVIAVRRTPPSDTESDGHAEVHATERLSELLPRAQVLLIALPGTPETSGLLGESELALLPAGGLLVNVGRGSVVDEAALYHALASGRLAAAGIDVWYRYPRSEDERGSTMPSEYPFHELDQVVLSPHRAGWLGREDDSRIAYLAAMLNEAASGRELPNRIDLERGY